MNKLVCIAILAFSATLVAQQSSQNGNKEQDQSTGQKKVYTNDDFPDKATPPAQDEKAQGDASKESEKESKDDAAKQAAGLATEHQVDAPRDENGNIIKPEDTAHKSDKKPAEEANDAEKKAADSTDEADKKSAEGTTEAKSKKSKELKESDESADKEKDAKSDKDVQAKLDAEWKDKIDSQKAKIASVQREYDLTDREYKLFATTYYADAGNRLRDQKDFHDHETSYRDKLNTLKQQIADEQTKLGDLQDQAHKAGANKAYD